MEGHEIFQDNNNIAIVFNYIMGFVKGRSCGKMSSMKYKNFVVKQVGRGSKERDYPGLSVKSVEKNFENHGVQNVSQYGLNFWFIKEQIIIAVKETLVNITLCYILPLVSDIWSQLSLTKCFFAFYYFLFLFSNLYLVSLLAAEPGLLYCVFICCIYPFFCSWTSGQSLHHMMSSTAKIQHSSISLIC